MVNLNSTFSLTSRPAAGLLLLGAALAGHTSHAQTAFQQNTLTVVRYGDRAGMSVPSGTLPVSLDEYTTTGTLVRSLDLPTADAAANYGIVGSAVRSNNDGVAGISPDRSKLVLAGFNVAVGSSNPNGSSAARVLAVITANGAVASTTGVTGTGSPIRAAAVSNAGGLFLGFGAESLGIVYAPTAPPAVPPAVSTATTVTNTVSVKKMAIYDGNLYFSTTSNGALTAGAKLRRYTGVPTASAVPTDLPGIPATSTGTAGPFFMFDANPAVPGVDLLYYFDDVSTGSILNKYTYNGTTWTARGTYTVAGLQGDMLIKDVTGRFENGVPALYAVSYTSLIKLTDAAAYTANANVTQTTLVDNAYVNGANTLPFAFRGVTFSPGTREAISLATAPAQLARQVVVYPNPAQGTVQLSLPAELSTTQLTASLVNVLGQVVRTQALPAGASHTLPLTGLTAGLYTLRLETSQGTVNKRLVVE